MDLAAGVPVGTGPDGDGHRQRCPPDGEGARPRERSWGSVQWLDGRAVAAGHARG
jgi:hypothetical protein